ncbi:MULTISPECIES: tetratricopeptide repeat-containing sensor histidine kinase [Roseivirga]|uniref:histidine kinase n=1 Tax=Roseivirga spongicola TaxID=333140 RepID=A0A150X945_9BACT|nr:MULTISPECIES: tetratricopeptide repeat protein [Roseivirga]KYG75223.1 hypothetical protein AWW68_10475 [Roseivirga spongicola]MBO6661986.1 sensor histidine kinase [Roseivirga sp.]MBO6909425.1 sensor histidine kinase [Roseivirga sp.]WPZ08582.1 sensor histidine kinase [Roseivirga spongicola]
MWKIRRWSCLTLCLSIFSFSAFGQGAIDSLTTKLETASDSSELMMIYKALGDEYFNQENDLKALETYEKHLQISLAREDSFNILSGYFNVIQPLIYLEKLPRHLEIAREGFDYALKFSNLKYQVIFGNEIGVLYRKMGLGDSSIVYLNSALEASIVLKNKGYESFILENLGNTYSNQGDFIESIQSYLAAQKIYRESNDHKSLQELEYNLGVLYKKIGEYGKSMDSYKEVLQYFILQNDTTYIRGTLHNIASLYQIQNRLDSALIYATKSAKLEFNMDDLCNSGNSALLGRIHLGLEQLDSAEYYLNKELSTMENCNSKFYYSPAKSALGEIYLRKGRLEQSEAYFKESYNYAIANNYQEDIIESSKGLFQVYLAQNDYKKALTYHRKFKNAEDSLLNLDNTRKIAWLEANQRMNYLADSLEFERQLSETKLNAEINSQKVKRRTIVFIATTTLIIAGVWFYFLQKRKQIRHNEQLAKEREEGLQNVLVATETERSRISKDLHDGVGQQLSAIKLAMSDIMGKVEDSAKPQIAQLNDLLTRSAEEVRTISHQMMPRALVDHGLIEAIDDLLKNSFTYSEIEYEFEYKNIYSRFGERIEITIYRILQELINNVLKHSNATLVNVQLYKTGNQLTLLVEDNGDGLKHDKPKGHGLQNIKSRLTIVNGKVNFETSQGTTVFVSIPVDK